LVSASRMEIISKTLLTAKGRIYSRGLLFSQRKSIWNRGRISNLKMLLEIIFPYLWLFAKEFEKIFPKDLQKQASGASVVQNIK
jgi:hypothetical protein